MGNLRESVEDLRAISGGAPLQWGDVVLMQDLIAEIMREKHFEYSHGIISEIENKKMRAYGKATNYGGEHAMVC